MDLDFPKAHAASLQIFREEEKLDHRRRRRNRMRSSCLNCYASKRKCDKKRPCGRCVRLGTTGLCIYEVEDTGDWLTDATEFNEVKRLRQRIAELESVIRELKKNPHPRWTAPGGIVHDPNFFDSFRRSTQHDTAENICLSSAEIVDVTSMGVPVKAEENISCPPELVATTAIAHDILHSSPHAHPPQLPEPAVLCSRNSEVTRTGLDGGTTTTGITPYGFHDGPLDDVENLHLDLKSTPMSQTATSINTVISCNPFMTNLPGDSLSATRGPRFSNYTPTPTCEFQAAASAPVSQTDAPQISHKNLDSCNCLMDPLAFGPLLHLGISLRTSREALETLHPLSSDCVLYCQISILEKHIFSVPPHEKNTKVNPPQGPCLGSYSSCASNATSPHFYSKEPREYLLSHPLSHSYPETRESHQLSPRSPDPFAYMSDTAACNPLHP